MDMADTVVELGGQRQEGDRAYERLGEFIVRHSDVLIAIWNPQDQSPGRGGTRDVIRRATVEGLTVICIDARPPHEISILHGREQLPEAPGASPTPYSSEHLAVLLRRQLLFSEILEARGKRDKGTHRLDAVRRRFHDFVSERGFSVDAGSASDYVGKGPLILERRRPFMWGSVYRAVVRLLGPSRTAHAKNGRQPTSDPVEARGGVAPLPAGVRRSALDRIFAAFLRADQLAVYYSDLHRSIFMSIYICGGLALCAAAAALYFRERPIAGLEAQYAFAIVEFVLLAVVFLLWRTDHRRRCHDRWIEYRSIAEFLRPMIHLSLLGRAYPLNRLREQQEQVGRERVGHGGAARGWAFMYVETVLRWAGVPNVRMDPAGEHLRRCREFFAANWFGPQLNYHRTNARQAYAIGNKLQWFSQGMFWGAALMVVVKLLNGFYFHSASLGFVGLLAAVFPALGTIAFAVRNHAEFEISAQRSTSMSLRFERWEQRLERTGGSSDVDALGDLLDEAAESAIRETSDWGEIFEVKVSETG